MEKFLDIPPPGQEYSANADLGATSQKTRQNDVFLPIAILRYFLLRCRAAGPVRGPAADTQSNPRPITVLAKETVRTRGKLQEKACRIGQESMRNTCICKK